MRAYESMFVMRPTLEEEQIKALVEKFGRVITGYNGTVESAELWGKRRLAYEIDDLREGIYLLLRFTAGSDAIQELDRQYKLSEDVIRYLIVREQIPSKNPA